MSTFRLLMVASLIATGCSSEKGFKSSVGTKSAEQIPTPPQETSPEENSIPKDPETKDPVSPNETLPDPMIKKAPIKLRTAYSSNTGEVSGTWIAEETYIGYLILYTRSKASPSWQPKDGVSYKPGVIDEMHEIVYVGNGTEFHHQTSEKNFSHMIIGFDSKLRYSGNWRVGQSTVDK